MAHGTSPPSQGNGVPWWLLFIAAMVLAVAFLVIAFITYSRADDTGMTEPIWTRIVLVLQGIQALAFTAVGWLFGREVHRGEAQQAKEQAKDAKDNADDAKQDAKQARDESAAARDIEREATQRATKAETAGWRLAEAVRAHAEAHSGGSPISAEGGDENAPASAGPAPTDLDYLKGLADTLFSPH